MKGYLVLEDGTYFEGRMFGAEVEVEGEVVFSTGMVGYTEALTDPSYCGQILVLTYPLIGNYGVARPTVAGVFGATSFESERIQVRGLVVSSYIEEYSHWSAGRSLGNWLKESSIGAIEGVDTRELAIKLRDRGVMLGYLAQARKNKFAVTDPISENLVAHVSCKKKEYYGKGKIKIVLVDCGVKRGIIEELVKRNVSVIRVPWDFDFVSEGSFTYDGVIISNGPGDPKIADKTIKTVALLINRKVPVLGICLGNQILALAAGADTYKLKFGHRSHNQPVIDRSGKCFLTTQNHGFAVNKKTIKKGWREWFTNLNDGTNEGIRHESLPFMSVQFHPEGRPGPYDTNWVFDEFLNSLKHENKRAKD